MLIATDIGMATFLRSIFTHQNSDGSPKYTVAVAPPEGSRQALANYNESSQIGVPGLTVWRSDIAIDYERYNMPMASRGIPWRLNNDAKTYGFMKAIPVSAVYSVRGFARKLSDMVQMERELAFCHIYQVIKAKYKVADHELRWPLWIGDTDYDPIISKETGKVIFHSFKVDFEVDTWWIREYPIPWIEKIVVDFAEVLDGDPVTFQHLEQVEFTILDKEKATPPRVRNHADYLENLTDNGLAYTRTDPDYEDSPRPEYDTEE